jgi:hypothetical protein
VGGAEAADAAPFDLPVSLERIRRDLGREPQLTVVWPREPHFRVRVDRHQPLTFDDVRPEPQLKAPPRTTGIDLLSLIKGVVSNSRRERDEREARQAVDDALRQYCALQPDRGASIPSCASVMVP